MNILFLSNNEISQPLFRWLSENADENVRFYDAKLTPSVIEDIKPDWVVSYNYRFIIGKQAIAMLPDRIINLHISLLPWNKGANPNFWSFVDNSPKGVTIHLIDEGIDTGDILVQKEVWFDQETETFASTYTKLNEEIQELFKANWEKIKNGEIKPFKPEIEGSCHPMKDFEKYKPIFDMESWNIKISDFKRKYL